MAAYEKELIEEVKRQEAYYKRLDRTAQLIFTVFGFLVGLTIWYLVQ